MKKEKSEKKMKRPIKYIKWIIVRCPRCHKEQRVKVSLSIREETLRCVYCKYPLFHRPIYFSLTLIDMPHPTTIRDTILRYLDKEEQERAIHEVRIKILRAYLEVLNAYSEEELREYLLESRKKRQLIKIIEL